MKSMWRVFAVGVGAIALVACSPTTTPSVVPPTAAPVQAPASVDTTLTRSDDQGAVSVEVTPLTLDPNADPLNFAVTLSTHTVDLSWDLATRATLSTDTGVEVQGSSWPINSGHHVEGTLSFPARTTDGRNLLEGARTLTLTLRDTDVPTRTFVWELTQ